MPNQPFVLLSGGPDSVTLAYWLVKRKGLRPRALFVDYGQPTRRAELRTARYFAGKLGCEFHVLNMNGLFQSFQAIDPEPKGGGKGGLTRMAGCNDAYVQVLTAATYAAGAKAKELYLGVHHDDEVHFIETFEVLALQQKTVRLVDRKNFRDFSYQLPFRKYTKAQIMAIGRQLGVPLGKTWSCY